MKADRCEEINDTFIYDVSFTDLLTLKRWSVSGVEIFLKNCRAVKAASVERWHSWPRECNQSANIKFSTCSSLTQLRNEIAIHLIWLLKLLKSAQKWPTTLTRVTLPNWDHVTIHQTAPYSWDAVHFCNWVGGDQTKLSTSKSRNHENRLREPETLPEFRANFCV